MFNRRDMLTVCGVAAVGTALSGKDAKAHEEKPASVALKDEEYFARYGEELAQEHPLTKEGRLVRDSGSDILKFIEDNYPGGKIVGIKTLKSYVDFDHPGGAEIRQDFVVLVEVPGHEPFTCATSYSTRLDFLEKVHVWNKNRRS